MITKQNVVAYWTLGWRLNFFKSSWGNVDVLSWPFFQVPVSFTIIGSIASSTLKFIYNTRHEVVIQTIFKTEIIWFIWFLNTIWILEQLNVLLRTFWSFVLVWRDSFPKTGRTNVRVFFSAIKTWGCVRYNRSKNVLKHLSMNDIGYPFLINVFQKY